MLALIVSQTHTSIAKRLQEPLDSLPDCECAGVVSWDQAERSVRELRPDLVLFCVSSERGLEAMAGLRAHQPTGLVAVGPAVDPKFIIGALHSGADDFLDQDDLESEFAAIVERVLAKQDRSCSQGRIIALLSAGGGCGASTLSVNLAVTLAKEKGTCCLVDLHPGRGDLAPLLDIQPAFTLSDLCENETRLDQAMFEKMLVTHGSGARLLAAPRDLGDLHALTARGVTQALELARGIFRDTFVDVADCVQDEQVAALQQAGGIFLVCRLDFTSIRNARRMLDHCAKLSLPGSIKVVVNHFGQAQELPIDEAERALNDKLSHFVPYDARTVCSANNTGMPAVIKEPKAKFSLAVQKLAHVRFDEVSRAAPTMQRTWNRIKDLVHIS